MARASLRPSPYGHAWLTYALCLSMIVIHLTVEWPGDAVAAVDRASAAHRLELLARGAKSVALVADTGESWRLFSAHLVHTSWIHLIFNLAFLLPVAGALEVVTRRSDFCLLMAAIATSAGVFSLAWTPEISAGGSGLVYGTLAAAVLLGLRHSHQMDHKLRMHFGLWALPFLLIILAVGANNPHLDHFNHLGGLVAGLLITPWIRLREGVAQRERPRLPSQQGLCARWIACGTLVATTLVLSPGLARHFQSARLQHIAGLEFWLPGGWERYTAGGVDHTERSDPADPGRRIARFGGATDLVTIEVWALADASTLAQRDFAARRRPSTHGRSQLAPAAAVTSRPPASGHSCAHRPHEAMDCVRIERYVRSGVATLRFRRILATHQGTVEVRFELPEGWQHKYSETRQAIFGSIRIEHDADA